MRAEKHNDFVGRICLNCTSRAGPARHALNSYVDVEAMDRYRPLVPNPLVTDLCNLAVDVRDRHGAKVELSGATVDIRTAYEQYFHSGDVPLFFGTVVEVECGGGWKKVVIAWVGGCYGFVRGGYAYSEIQQFLDYEHNRDNPRESVTYVDDGLIITVSEAIDASTARYQDAARQILGNQSIKAEKTKVYDGHLIGIGWHFDFVKWTVRPKDMARRRLLYRWRVLLQSCESGQDRADAARAGVERARTDSRAQSTRAGLASRWQAWAEACQYHGSDPDVDYRRMGEEASVKV